MNEEIINLIKGAEEMIECKHENITVDEVYGEQFCEDCGGFIDKD